MSRARLASVVDTLPEQQGARVALLRVLLRRASDALLPALARCVLLEIRSQSRFRKARR